jgi:hypothetical protein
MTHYTITCPYTNTTIKRTTSEYEAIATMRQFTTYTFGEIYQLSKKNNPLTLSSSMGIMYTMTKEID